MGEKDERISEVTQQLRFAPATVLSLSSADPATSQAFLGPNSWLAAIAHACRVFSEASRQAGRRAQRDVCGVQSVESEAGEAGRQACAWCDVRGVQSMRRRPAGRGVVRRVR